MPDAYDHISLMCRLKAAQTRNKELESRQEIQCLFVRKIKRICL